MRSLSEVFWKLAPYIAAFGIVYGACEYAVIYGAWRATIITGGIVGFAFLAAELLYPMWFSARK